MSSMNGIERSLVVMQPYSSWICEGLKTLEMRSTNTNIRGRIGIIDKGTGLIIGTCILNNVYKFTNKQLLSDKFKSLHRIDFSSNPELMKYNYAWEMIEPVKFKEPIKYNHPQGAVIWVRSGAWE